MKKKGEGDRISVRIPKGSDLKQRLANAVEQTGVDEPILVLRAVEAAMDYIEREGSITFPLQISPKNRPAAARR
ncbi:MAG: hypothetical protein M3Y27_10000 [Acidobacteriota bacterium]|nr:hypothetical protein [Acidobacteriota bacterium]